MPYGGGGVDLEERIYNGVILKKNNKKTDHPLHALVPG